MLVELNLPTKDAHGLFRQLDKNIRSGFKSSSLQSGNHGDRLISDACASPRFELS